MKTRYLVLVAIVACTMIFVVQVALITLLLAPANDPCAYITVIYDENDRTETLYIRKRNRVEPKHGRYSCAFVKVDVAKPTPYWEMEF